MKQLVWNHNTAQHCLIKPNKFTLDVLDQFIIYHKLGRENQKMFLRQEYLSQMVMRFFDLNHLSAK